jgi:uncharacterized membrane protein/protein-disulfide isomerase
MTGLIMLCLALSAYLSWHYLMGGEMIGCGIESSCDRVLNGRWSTIGGVLPVSGLAAGTYLAMLAASLFVGSDAEDSIRRLAWRALLVLAGAAAGSAVWFIIVQKWIIGSFCPYCMTAHITGLLLAALVIWKAPRQFDSLSTPRRMIGNFSAIGMASVGLVLSGISALSQIYFVPPAAYRVGEAQNDSPAFDYHAVPIVGSPDATNIVTVLFDYKCPHCQELHLMLDEAVRRYGGKLAFVLCPSPLNTNCNPYVPINVDEFKGSCELAKVALAVWVARREAFQDFDRWMFSYETGDRWQPRSLDAAKSKAVELVGQAKFDAALADPWIDRYLQTCIRIYGGTVQSAVNIRRANAVPKLVFGPRWVIPEPNNADDLISILHDSLQVPGL